MDIRKRCGSRVAAGLSVTAAVVGLTTAAAHASQIRSVAHAPHISAQRAARYDYTGRGDGASPAFGHRRGGADSNWTGVVGKPKVIVTTDPEKDDTNSLIRYLLMSDEFDTQGLIVASSEFHWAGDGQGTRYFFDGAEYTHFPLYIPDPCPCTQYRWPAGENHVQQALDAYTQVYKNLKAQDPNYPTPAYLDSRYALGNIEYQGDMGEDTAGSDEIENVLLRNTAGPVFLLAWGGESTIARGLQQIQLTYQHTREWPAIYKKISNETIIQPSGQQDDTQAVYITPNWPDIRIEDPTADGGPGGSLGYGAELSATPTTAPYYSPAWMEANIIGKGPLGRLYYSWGDGRQMVAGDPTDYFGLSGYTTAQLQAMGYFVWMPPQPKGSFLGEGDTFTYLNLLANGLRDDENLTWGSASGGSYLPELMNEEAARLDWSTTSEYRAVNHDPVATIDGPVMLHAAPGQTVHIRASASDPDQNTLSYAWSQDSLIDTYPGSVTLSGASAPRTSLTVPADAQPGQTIHLILAVTDDGTPPLTTYQRVVITVGRDAFHLPARRES